MHVHVSRRVTDMSDVSATCMWSMSCGNVHTQLRMHTSNVKHIQYIHTYAYSYVFFSHTVYIYIYYIYTCIHVHICITCIYLFEASLFMIVVS